MMLGLERRKLTRSMRPMVGVAAVLLFLGLMLVGFWTYAQTQTGGDVEFRYTFENESYFNGLTFALYAFYFAARLILPIFVATEGGVQLAGEVAQGTLRMLLTRPVSRRRIFAAKWLVAALWSALLTGLLLALSLGLGLIAVGWGELKLYPGVLQMTDRPQTLSQSEALFRFALAWPAATLSMWTTLGLAMWCSAYSRSAVNAVALAVATFLIASVISDIHFFAELRPYLFTTYQSYWRALFREQIPWGEFLRDGAKLAAFGCLFAGLALRRFRRREETA